MLSVPDPPVAQPSVLRGVSHANDVLPNEIANVVCTVTLRQRSVWTLMNAVAFLTSVPWVLALILWEVTVVNVAKDVSTTL